MQRAGWRGGGRRDWASDQSGREGEGCSLGETNPRPSTKVVIAGLLLDNKISMKKLNINALSFIGDFMSPRLLVGNKGYLLLTTDCNVAGTEIIELWQWWKGGNFIRSACSPFLVAMLNSFLRRLGNINNIMQGKKPAREEEEDNDD